MLSFSQFNKKVKKNLIANKLGAPVYVQHGTHSRHSPGTPVYVQHGKHSQKKSKLTEGKDYLEGDKYEAAKRKTVEHLHNVNDHIAPGGPEAVHNKLEKHYAKNPHAKGHFGEYSDESWKTNYALHHHHESGGHPNKLPDKEEYDLGSHGHKHIRGLDKALAHNKTKKPMTVFAGVGFHPGAMAAKHKEGHIHMPSYTSSSIHPGVAADFAKPLVKGTSGSGGESYKRYNPSHDKKKEGADHHIMRMNLPKGHPGSYIAHHSWAPEEHEFLLPRKQTMKVHPTPTVTEFKHGKITHRMHVWDVTPVSSKKKVVAVPKVPKVKA